MPTLRPTRGVRLLSALVLIALPLAGCRTADAGSNSSGDGALTATAGVSLQSGVEAAGGATASPAPSSASSPAGAAPVAAGILHTVHSPGRVADDEPEIGPGRCHVRTGRGGQSLPDPTCTPGAIDPAVTQADIAATICRPGYTATVRPPAWNFGQWETVTASMYGITATAGEYDHLIPLDLGGANASSNLWLEPGPVPNVKDAVEKRLHIAVCTRRMTLSAAQRAIATDWTTVP
jgi:hypothetical protein